MNTLFWALVVIGVLIFIHEAGHFLAARWLKVRVLVFSLGFGPRLWSRMDRRGETEFALAAIPLGGYIKLFGESLDDENPISPEEQPFAFSYRPVSHRSAIVLAGPLFNLISAVLFLAIAFMIGMEELLPVVGGVVSGMPAETAGLQKGDRITFINDQAVERWEAMSVLIRGSGGEPLEITLERGPSSLTIRVLPRVMETTDITGSIVREARIGISPDPTTFALTRYDPLTALDKAWRTAWRLAVDTLDGIWKLLTRAIAADQIGGPLLIAELAGKSAGLGPSNFLYFMALISVNLGILNLLPIPVLDGGHLFFFAIEAVLGKPVHEKIHMMAIRVGIFLLACLMILAFYNDLVRLFTTK